MQADTRIFQVKMQVLVIGISACVLFYYVFFFSNFHHEVPSGQALSQLLCSNIAGHDISHVNCICFFQFMQLYSHFGKCVDESICSFLRNCSTLLRHWSLQVKQGVLYAYSKWAMYHHILVLWYSSCVFAFESAMCAFPASSEIFQVQNFFS